MKSKYLRVIYLLVALQSYFLQAQTINWNAIDKNKNLLHVFVGADHATVYGIGYGHKLNTKLPIILATTVTVPFGEKTVDDFKVKIGGQSSIYKYKNFFGAVSLQSIYRRYSTEYVVIQNFGSDVKGTFGFYKPKWFTALEVGFDKAIVSHFKHTQRYRDEVYNDVTDGWYQPSTGGNFYYGFQAGFNFNKNQVALNLGKIVSQDFSTKPSVPFYLSIGYMLHL
ncbi:hypothetical protein [Flavobacterium sp.]|uniref:hypothetical protein n=1 Tax=Flavobacterium sp. TaxID=239 RepID=UPI002FDADAFF